MKPLLKLRLCVHENLVRLCHSCYTGLRKLEVRGEREFLLVKGDAGRDTVFYLHFETQSRIRPCLCLRRLYIFFVSHLLYICTILIRHIIEEFTIKTKSFVMCKFLDS